MSDTSDQKPEPEIRRGDFAREKGEIILREHEYDGIQEFDQKLPNWWLFTFYGAIVWFVLHWGAYYYTQAFQTDEEKIVAELAALQEKKKQALATTLAALDDESMMRDWVANPEVVARGLATYSTYCIACHGPDLSATLEAAGNKVPLPGLSLVDHEWKYGAKPMDVFKIVNDGTPADAPGHNGARMQPWGQTLTPDQVAEVTAYVISQNPEDFPQP
ncbi:MAG TPA: cbb3-type cytochrome c oxidase N-terminal domain-containing protein [Bacteroidia bacterium]|nr:cbb3-type cytochrome c oxidase N-terminal domain-containing protein [Bacteroidia bacterium]